MGWTSAWTAVENADASEIVAALGLTETGQVLTEWYPPGLCWFRLGNWLVVFCDGYQNFDRVTAEQARELSEGRRVLHLRQSDFAMSDSLTCFLSGAVVWEVDHRSGESGSPFVAGTPPEQLAPILAKQRRIQAESDPDVDHIYEVAPALGMALTGFRHDRHHRRGRFHVLR